MINRKENIRDFRSENNKNNTKDSLKISKSLNGSMIEGLDIINDMLVLGYPDFLNVDENLTCDKWK